MIPYRRFSPPALLLLLTGCSLATPKWSASVADKTKTLTLPGELHEKIAYVDLPAPVDAPTLVFLHGLGQSKACWQFIVPAFQDRYRLVLVDLLGAGDSTKLERDYAPAAQATEVDALIRELDVGKYALIGFSYGGAVALHVARERFADGGSTPSGLFLIGPAALDFPPPERFSWTRNPLIRCMLIWLGNPDEIAKTMLRGSFYRDERITPDLLAEYAFEHRTPEARAATLAMSARLFDEVEARRGKEADFAAIRCPTWIIRGDHDTVVPADVGLRLTLLMPQTKLFEVVDCGHSPAEERPEETIGLLRKFLGDAK